MKKLTTRFPHLAFLPSHMTLSIPSMHLNTTTYEASITKYSTYIKAATISIIEPEESTETPRNQR